MLVVFAITRFSYSNNYNDDKTTTTTKNNHLKNNNQLTFSRTIRTTWQHPPKNNSSENNNDNKNGTSQDFRLGKILVDHILIAEISKNGDNSVGTSVVKDFPEVLSQNFVEDLLKLEDVLAVDEAVGEDSESLVDPQPD